MSVVVSDTSPIRALSYLGRLELLSSLFGEVIVPTAVAAELLRLKPAEPRLELAAVPAVRVVAPGNAARVYELSAQKLDAGESEAIALAEELGADLLLIDERRGDVIARAAGLSTVGVLGLLVRAKRTGSIERLAPLIDRLRSGLNFYVSGSLKAEVLRLAGE